MSLFKTFFPTGVLQWLGALVVLVCVGLVAGGLFAWSGLYNVAASKKHAPAIQSVIAFAKTNSIARQSSDPPPRPPVDESAQVKRAAVHYDRECAFCHGAPDKKQSGVLRNMRPEPPRMPHAVSELKTNELFWVIRHGLKYSGMPGWPHPGRSDEVWAMASFVQGIEEMGADRYRQLAEVDPPAPPEGAPQAARTCARCHGYDGLGKGEGAFPILAIQTETYLHNSLEAYAEDRRHSGIMGPMAKVLEKPQIDALAKWYAERPTDQLPSGGEAPQDLIDRGRQIARDGLPEQDVEACISCHNEAEGKRFDKSFPQLEGQYADYIATQLGAWKHRGRGRTREGELMDPMYEVSHALSARDIRAVSAYYASKEED